MKRPKQHQIDDSAQAVLRSLLPLPWNLNRQHNDYGKDYVVELGSTKDVLTGVSFYAQLKGQAVCKPVNKGREFSFQLKKKHALYYADQVRDLPVFLFLVDTARREGWWLFLQPVLASTDTWRSKSHAGVRIPVENVISPSDGLEAAIHEACRWMRVRYPTSIRESIEAHTRGIRELDPRFDVQFRADNDGFHFELRAAEPVAFQVSPRSLAAQERFLSLIRKGGQAEFTRDEIEVKGSPVIDGKEWEKLTWRSGGAIEVDVHLSVISENGADLGSLRMRGQLTVGLGEAGFKATLPYSPFSLQVSGICPEGTPATATSTLDISIWNGQKLLELPYFVQLRDFCKALERGKAIKILVARNGNEIFSMETDSAQLIPSVSLLNSLLIHVEKVRLLDEKFELACVWSDEILEESTVETVEELFAVACSGGFERRWPSVGFSATVPRAYSISHLALPQDYRIVGGKSYRFLDRQVDLDKLETIYSAMVLAEPDDPQFDESAETRRVTFVGTDATVVTVRHIAGGAAKDLEVSDEVR